MNIGRFLWTLLDPATAKTRRSNAALAAVEAGPLYIRRLEERRVLAAGLLASAIDPGGDAKAMSAVNDPIQTMSVPPAITVPGGQTTTEGSPLVFSAATGRPIRVDDPDIGSTPLFVQLTAFEAQGRVTPYISFGSTAGLNSFTGNGVNVFQLQGSLSAINSALASVTFRSIDNGDFTLTISATDTVTGESDSDSIAVQVANANPQLRLRQGSITEGSFANATLEASDPGILDTVQITWAVSYRGSPIAQGVGRSVGFFAANDGDYNVTATATDQDGGVTTLYDRVIVANANPNVSLFSSVRNGITYLTVEITDPGAELFIVDVHWSQNAASPETFTSTQRTLTVTHEYTPDEVALEHESLTIAVQVRDDHGSGRATLSLVETSGVEVARPSIEPLVRHAPPEREAAVRPPLGGSPPQVTVADVARGAISGKQEQPALHQFVVRLVGPDGEESGNYPLPDEALENLPAFLTKLGVPDGHYRVYLVAGDLERLVIDGHLRAGHLIDPRDESQPTFDRPPASEDESTNRHGAGPVDEAGAVIQPAAPRADMSQALSGFLEADVNKVDMWADDSANLLTVVDASVTAEEGLPFTTQDAAATLATINPSDSATGNVLLGGSVMAFAGAIALSTLTARRVRTREFQRSSFRFNKAARLGRKLASPLRAPPLPRAVLNRKRFQSASRLARQRALQIQTPAYDGAGTNIIAP